MARAETLEIEGTPKQLVAKLEGLPSKKRYRLTEVGDSANGQPTRPKPVLTDPKNAASIALLRSWIAQAPTEPEAIREAEEGLREFQRNMNLPRKEAGARLLYPEVE